MGTLHDGSIVFSGLEQETRWQFEVYALNDASDEDPLNVAMQMTGPADG